MTHPMRYLPNKAQKPPRGTLLNKTHPLSRDMVTCLVMNEAGGMALFDAAAQRIWTPDNAANRPSWTLDGIFPGLDFNGNDRFEISGGAEHYNITQELTIVTEVWLANITDNHEFAVKGDYDNNWDFEFLIEPVAGGKYDLYVDAAGGDDSYSASVAAQGVYQKVAFTRRGSTVKWFIDGVLDNVDTGFTSANFTTGGSDLIIGESYVPYTMNFWIGYLYIWRRALGDEEVLWLQREPFCMF